MTRQRQERMSNKPKRGKQAQQDSPFIIRHTGKPPRHSTHYSHTRILHIRTHLYIYYIYDIYIWQSQSAKYSLATNRSMNQDGNSCICIYITPGYPENQLNSSFGNKSKFGTYEFQNFLSCVHTEHHISTKQFTGKYFVPEDAILSRAGIYLKQN